VSSLLVRRGDHVKAGQVYARLRADDQTIDATADRDFTVFRIVRKVGEAVEEGHPIVFAETSLWSQYLVTLSNYARFDFGVTFESKGQRSVLQNIAETLPVSAELGLYALIIALFFGVSSGLIAGLRHNTWVDHTTMSAAMIGISIPSIVLGPVFILVFIMKLQWLPAHGGWEVGPFTGWGQKILPALTLGLVYAAYFARLTRGGMLEVIGQDWMRTARAKGLPPSIIVFRHALKAAILPVVTFMGPALAHLLVGSVVVEIIFAIPGISKYFVVSAINRDYPMVMGVVVLYSIFLVCFNLLVDIAYAYLDPRVKYE
jgi:oligopeptide transport system permease protein